MLYLLLAAWLGMNGAMRWVHGSSTTTWGRRPLCFQGVDPPGSGLFDLRNSWQCFPQLVDYHNTRVAQEDGVQEREKSVAAQQAGQLGPGPMPGQPCGYMSVQGVKGRMAACTGNGLA